MATDVFDNVPHKLTPDGRLVPDLGAPPLMREPPDQELAYWNGEIAARDATISRLRAELAAIQAAYDKATGGGQTTLVDGFDQMAADISRLRAELAALK